DALAGDEVGQDALETQLALVVVEERQLLQVDLVEEELLEAADLRGLARGHRAVGPGGDGADLPSEVGSEAAAHGTYAAFVATGPSSHGMTVGARRDTSTPSGWVRIM